MQIRVTSTDSEEVLEMIAAGRTYFTMANGEDTESYYVTP